MVLCRATHSGSKFMGLPLYNFKIFFLIFTKVAEILAQFAVLLKVKSRTFRRTEAFYLQNLIEF